MWKWPGTGASILLKRSAFGYLLVESDEMIRGNIDAYRKFNGHGWVGDR